MPPPILRTLAHRRAPWGAPGERRELGIALGLSAWEDSGAWAPYGCGTFAPRPASPRQHGSPRWSIAIAVPSAVTLVIALIPLAAGGPTVTCALSTKGKCSITKSGILLSQTSITFSVTGITATAPYAPAYNHHPDGSSNGTSILIVK